MGYCNQLYQMGYQQAIEEQFHQTTSEGNGRCELHPDCGGLFNQTSCCPSSTYGRWQSNAEIPDGMCDPELFEWMKAPMDAFQVEVVTSLL